jgi:ferrous iron transport protein B
MVIALNMMDEVRAAGDAFDVAELARELGLPIIPISARAGEGLDKLITAARDTVLDKKTPPITDICEGALHEALHAIGYLVGEKAAATQLPVRYAATKLTEGDEPVACNLRLDDTERHIIKEIVARMEEKLGSECDCAIADARYGYIDHLVNVHIRRGRADGTPTRSQRIDSVLTHKIAAIPLFIAVMAGVFWLTFGPVGAFLSDSFASLLGLLSDLAAQGLENAGVSELLRALIVEGVLGGVFAMLGFLPVIILLFFFLALLEDSGYMARAAFVMDRLLRGIGLSGRAFIPMLVGFGCSVPAIMATRTMQSQKERRLAIFIMPFMSCAARVPIYALFAAAFFPSRAALVMTVIYALGILIAILFSFFFKDLPFFKAEKTPFVMELPPYRLPSPKTVLRLLGDKARDFIRRAFTIIFAASVVIWCLSTFDITLRPAADAGSASILEEAGSFIAPVFSPLGFGDWKSSTALLTGLTAKEAVVSTMTVLHKTSEEDLPAVIGQIYTPLTAMSFMVFVLLYMPCVAAFAAMRRELGRMRYAVAAAATQTGVAWLCAFLVYQGGRLLTGG